MNRDRIERLRAFLERYQGKPVTWGIDDCSACPALWVAEETGWKVDYPSYSSEAEGLALKARHGGLVPIWDERIGEHLVERFDDPQPGDVGIIDTRLWGQIGGIILAGGIIALRKETPDKLKGGWHPFGPVRRFEKVWAVE